MVRGVLCSVLFSCYIFWFVLVVPVWFELIIMLSNECKKELVVGYHEFIHEACWDGMTIIHTVLGNAPYSMQTVCRAFGNTSFELIDMPCN